MQRLPSRSRCWLVLLLLGGAWGCSSKADPPRLVPVQGKVLYRSRPVASARVQFAPEPDTPGEIATAWTGSDGAFTLQTHPHGDGAVPGRYRVQVSLVPGAAGIPEVYSDPNSTPLRIVIPETGLSSCVLKLADQ